MFLCFALILLICPLCPCPSSPPLAKNVSIMQSWPSANRKLIDVCQRFLMFRRLRLIIAQHFSESSTTPLILPLPLLQTLPLLQPLPQPIVAWTMLTINHPSCCNFRLNSNAHCILGLNWDVSLSLRLPFSLWNNARVSGKAQLIFFFIYKWNDLFHYF